MKKSNEFNDISPRNRSQTKSLDEFAESTGMSATPYEEEGSQDAVWFISESKTEEAPFPISMLT